MDDVARLSPRDRAELFGTASFRRGDMRPEVVEKDFWVCWVLKQIFGLDAALFAPIFKGGTSLSKFYGAIRRFSEDVDLSVDRRLLGLGEDEATLRASSRKQRGRFLDRLSETCREAVATRFVPALEGRFTESLGRPSTIASSWSVTIDPEDADRQTILFAYPRYAERPKAAEAPYLRPVVRLEMGARGESWPSENGAIVPYAAEALPEAFGDPHCQVRVLAAERTFWEKATLLHACYHRPSDQRLPDRLSRHYYDVARLHEVGIGKRALADLPLLRRVAAHKDLFFPAKWARYEAAVPGTLRLVPPQARRQEIETDYAKMREMFFEEPPSLDRVFALIREVEDLVNAAG